MADLITRLKVDSTEYDAKIKRAAQGLQHYVQSAHDSGDVIGRLLGDTKKYVESLGNMATVSTTARGRLNELTAAFTDLRSLYNSLSEEEKSAKGGFGQELNKQLEILKGRINDTKKELKDIDQELGNTKQAEDGAKGGLEGLTSALGINVKSLAGWGAALTAGKMALDVAKDAFFASEATVDEWGRVVDSSKSLYEGFLTALNTGDISGYLSRIDEIVSAARTAYNELDRLGTMKTIQAPKVSAQQTENERIRMMIQTGRYIAPVDGRRNAVFNGREMQNGDKLTAGQIRYLEKQLQNGMQTVVKLVGNEVKQTGKAIDAVYERQAKELGISLKEFRKGTSSMEEFDKRMAGYDKYQQWREQHTTIDQQSGREIVARGNPYAEYGKWGTFRVDGDRYNQLVQLIQQRDQQAAQAYGMQSQAYRTMNRAEGFTVSKLMGNGGKGGKTGEVTTPKETKVEEILPEGSMADLQKKMSDLKKEQTKVTDPTDWQIYASLIADVTAKMDELKGKTKQAVPDMKLSKSAQADLNFMMGPTNLASVNQYISGIKDQLKEADLGTTLYDSLTEKLKDATMFQSVLTQAIAGGASAADLSGVAQEIKQKLLEGDIDESAWQEFLDKINELIQNADLKLTFDVDTKSVTTAVKQQKKETAEMAKEWQAAGTAIQAVGSAMSQIEDPAAKVLGIIAQAVATMALSYSQAAASPAVTGSGWGWIAFAATGLATMISSINGIKQATEGFAQGGVIQGNSMSGDRLRLPVDGGLGMIGVNSGEIILNRAQQGNLASQLEGGGIGNLHLDTVISAEDIRLILNNNGRRTGRGEYVTTRNSRT